MSETDTPEPEDEIDACHSWRLTAWQLDGLGAQIVRSYIRNGQEGDLLNDYNLSLEQARFVLRCYELASLPIWDAEALAEGLTIEEWEGEGFNWGRESKESVKRRIELAQAAGFLPLHFRAKQGFEWAEKQGLHLHCGLKEAVRRIALMYDGELDELWSTFLDRLDRQEEIPEVHSEDNLGRRERQIKAILQVAKSLGYPAMAIPKGGKAAIQRRCLQDSKLFTKDGFYKAWKAAKARNLIEVENPDQYRHQ